MLKDLTSYQVAWNSPDARWLEGCAISSATAGSVVLRAWEVASPISAADIIGSTSYIG
jgi:hypothetical protein